jgi:uroporphyrinogen decarboxylase
MLSVKSSKYRIEKALELEEPDIIPIFEIGITPPIVSKIIGRTPFYRNPSICLQEYAKGKHKEVNRKIAFDELECHRKLGFDAIRVSCGSIYYSLPAHVIPKRISENIWLINNIRYRYLPNTNVLWQLDTRFKEPEYITKYVHDHWNEIKEIPDGILEPLELIVKEASDEMFIIADADGTFPFSEAEMANFLTWIYTHPNIIREFISFSTKKAIEFGKACIDAGADAIFMPCDYAHKGGPFISPKRFKEFILPALKEQVEAFHKKGAYVIKHTDGNINLLLDDLVSSGIDALQCIDPSAGMKIYEVKEKYGDKICLMGNMNIETLIMKTTIEVNNEVKECIRKASPGGGHVFCTSNTVAVGAKFENFMTMIKTARKYGRYPIIL